MIKINLLGLKKEVKKSSAASAPVSLEGAKLVIFAIVFLVVGVAWVAYRDITLSKDATKIAEDMDKAKKEAGRLADVKASYERQELIKRNLVRQIDVIEGLERGRTGPVTMLNTMANTVVGTKTMWLTSFDTSGNKITVLGSATSMITVADFIRNMRNTGQFDNIEMKETAQDDKIKELRTYTFEITADVVKPAASETPSTTAMPAGKAK